MSIKEINVGLICFLLYVAAFWTYVVLKATGIIELSWLAVLAPLWLPAVFIGLYYFLGGKGGAE